MALIKCPECGQEISDTIEQCHYCGYRIKKKKQINKKLLTIPIAIVIIACIICVINIFSNNGSPANQAIKILEADFGKKVNIIAVYYNEEQNGCIIEFTSSGKSDIACVHLEDKAIGYKSIYEELSYKINDATISNEEKQKYAIEAVEYPYDVVWVYNLHVFGTNGSGWKKVQ